MAVWQYMEERGQLRGKQRRCPLDSRLGGTQSGSGRCGEKYLTSAGNQTPAVQPVAVAIPTELSRQPEKTTKMI
jgi:hypothetical protein